MITKQDIIKLKKVFVTKNDFYDKMDVVIGELRAIREELVVCSPTEEIGVRKMSEMPV